MSPRRLVFWLERVFRVFFPVYLRAGAFLCPVLDVFVTLDRLIASQNFVFVTDFRVSWQKDCSCFEAYHHESLSFWPLQQPKEVLDCDNRARTSFLSKLAEFLPR